MNIEEGWCFWSADFSMLATGKRNYGSVMLCRCKEDVEKWDKLSDEDKDKFDLWASGRGGTLEDAIVSANLAASHARPIP